MVSDEQDFIKCSVRLPNNLSQLSKGLIAIGLFQTQHCKTFADAKDKSGFSILSLTPLIGGKGNTNDNHKTCKAEIILGEAAENLPKVDTTININTTILPSTGLAVCANMVLLCCIFTQVQSDSIMDDNSHPTPFVFKAASTLASHITHQQLGETVAGNSEQAILPSYMVIACLDTIASNIGKEAANLTMICKACWDNWTAMPFAPFGAEYDALNTCIPQIKLASTGGVTFHPTMLYLNSEQKRKRDDKRMLAAAKQLKLMPGEPHTGGQAGLGKPTNHSNNPHGTLPL